MARALFSQWCAYCKRRTLHVGGGCFSIRAPRCTCCGSVNWTDKEPKPRAQW
jgi:hypothetical protein